MVIGTGAPMARSLQEYPMNMQIANVSTSSTEFLVVDAPCALIRVATALEGALTNANAVITVSKNGTSLGTITIAYTGSGARTVDSLELSPVTAANNFAEGDVVTVATNGGSTGSQKLGITLTFIRV